VSVHAARRSRSRFAARSLEPALLVSAGLSLVAGYVHLAFLQSHWQEWWGYGAFFLATGVGQLLFAPVLLRWPRPWLFAVGIAGNLAIAAMYFVSRTAGAPLGPHAHAIEPAGTVDLATTGAELAIVAILLLALDRVMRTRIINVLAAAGLVLWILRLSGHVA
jgi:hypothetical protein